MKTIYDYALAVVVMRSGLKSIIDQLIFVRKKNSSQVLDLTLGNRLLFQSADDVQYTIGNLLRDTTEGNKKRPFNTYAVYIPNKSL